MRVARERERAAVLIVALRVVDDKYLVGFCLLSSPALPSFRPADFFVLPQHKFSRQSCPTFIFKTPRASLRQEGLAFITCVTARKSQ